MRWLSRGRRSLSIEKASLLKFLSRLRRCLYSKVKGFPLLAYRLSAIRVIGCNATLVLSLAVWVPSRGQSMEMVLVVCYAPTFLKLRGQAREESINLNCKIGLLPI